MRCRPTSRACLRCRLTVGSEIVTRLPDMTSPYDAVRYRSLVDRSVLITGGASGIGASMVEAFTEQGSKVAFLDIDTTSGAALSQRTGARFIPCDLLDIQALR